MQHRRDCCEQLMDKNVRKLNRIKKTELTACEFLRNDTNSSQVRHFPFEEYFAIIVSSMSHRLDKLSKNVANSVLSNPGFALSDSSFVLNS